MLWLVAWTLLTSKSQVRGHPCDTGGGGKLSPSWQPGPCLATQEQAGPEPSHRPHCRGRSHTGTAIWWRRQRGRGDSVGRIGALQGRWSRWDFCSRRASGLTSRARHRGTAGPRGQIPLGQICPSREDRDRRTLLLRLSPGSHGQPGRDGSCQSPRLPPGGLSLEPARRCQTRARTQPGRAGPQRTARPSPKGKSNPRSAEISEQFMGADFSRCRTAIRWQLLGAHGGLEKLFLKFVPTADRRRNPRSLPLEQEA